jgi:hypothetical protein
MKKSHAVLLGMLFATSLYSLAQTMPSQPPGTDPEPPVAPGVVVPPPAVDPGIVKTPPTNVDPEAIERPPNNVDPGIIETPPPDGKPEEIDDQVPVTLAPPRDAGTHLANRRARESL